MGSCCSSCEDVEAPEPEERAPLLETPGSQAKGPEAPPASCTPEQAHLEAIVAEVASNIINVAQTHRLRPLECRERARRYRARLAKLELPAAYGGGAGESSRGPGRGSVSGAFGAFLRSYWKKKEQPCEPPPCHLCKPLLALAAPPVPFADVQQAIRFAADAHRAMQHVRVQPQEGLVVPFQAV
ncbi:ragulator complex protein LAMTOR1-like [Macrotis lagotis]|uniref:ragulator complex protein LAMTOR1-like n=1 Tax=Macrotis lagotis TaxID=92651 RepID=UPI003D686513